MENEGKGIGTASFGRWHQEGEDEEKDKVEGVDDDDDVVDDDVDVVDDDGLEKMM